MTRPPSILFLANLSGFHAKIPCAVPFSISPSISLKTTLPGSLAVLLSQNSFSTKRLFCLANSRSSVSCASIDKTWRSSSSDDLRQYIKYLIIASGIKLIKALHLHRQFLKISPHRLLRQRRNPNFVWEPPTFGGNAFGGIQNPLEFLGGNQSPREFSGRNPGRGGEARGQLLRQIKFGGVCLKKSEPILRRTPTNEDAPPPPRGLGGHQRKKFPAFRICARPISSKKERTFFFGVLPSKYSGRWRGDNPIRSGMAEFPPHPPSALPSLGRTDFSASSILDTNTMMDYSITLSVNIT